MKNAQVSTEYLIIMGFILIVCNVLIIAFISGSNDLNKSVTFYQTEKLVGVLTKVSDEVSFYGENSKKIIKARVPKGINNFQIQNHVITYILDSGLQIGEYTEADVSGTLPINPGLYKFIIQKQSGGIVISYE